MRPDIPIRRATSGDVTQAGVLLGTLHPHTTTRLDGVVFVPMQRRLDRS
jgi:hypothetical protein